MIKRVLEGIGLIPCMLLVFNVVLWMIALSGVKSEAFIHFVYFGLTYIIVLCLWELVKAIQNIGSCLKEILKANRELKSKFGQNNTEPYGNERY